jgi:hypothetical protein
MLAREIRTSPSFRYPRRAEGHGSACERCHALFQVSVAHDVVCLCAVVRLHQTTPDLLLPS